MIEHVRASKVGLASQIGPARIPPAYRPELIVEADFVSSKIILDQKIVASTTNFRDDEIIGPPGDPIISLEGGLAI